MIVICIFIFIHVHHSVHAMYVIALNELCLFVQVLHLSCESYVSFDKELSTLLVCPMS